MEYNEIIRTVMEDNGFSQEKMAKELGINQTTVSQWLLGRKKPGFDSIMLLYRKFKLTPNELFGIDGIDKKNYKIN